MYHSRAQNSESAIREVLRYFSIFERPLCWLEVWSYLPIRATKDEISAGLQKLVAQGEVSERKGFFAPVDHEKDFQSQSEAYRTSLPKILKARNFSYWARRLDSVKAIFVCNHLAWAGSSEDSDIDLFVITSVNKVWTVRTALTVPLALLDQRPRQGKTKDMYCLSFFLAENSLDLRRFALSEGDPYLAFWAATLLPLYDPENLHAKLISDSGLNEIFPNLSQTLLPTGSVPKIRIPIVGLFENWLMKLSMKKIFKNGLAEDGKCVALDKSTVKLHANDRREFFRSQFESRL